MSDRLADLPPTQDPPTPQEAASLQKYFGGGPSGSQQGQPDASGAPAHHTASKNNNLKLAAVGAVLFLALGNTFVDSLFCKVPYCGNPYIVLVLKALIMFLALFVVSKYAL